LNSDLFGKGKVPLQNKKHSQHIYLSKNLKIRFLASKFREKRVKINSPSPRNSKKMIMVQLPKNSS